MGFFIQTIFYWENYSLKIGNLNLFVNDGRIWKPCKIKRNNEAGETENFSIAGYETLSARLRPVPVYQLASTRPGPALRQVKQLK